MRGTTILSTSRLFAIGLVALIIVALVAAGGLLQTATAAGDWYVDPAGNDGNTCKGPGAANACLTIQGAVGKAAAGDTINLAVGTYAEDVDLNKAGLTLAGAGAASTTIDYAGQSGHNNAGMYVEADDVTVQDLTLTRSVAGSTPRYGLKVGAYNGVTINGVTVSNSYRTGLDVLGASNISIDGVALTNNGGHGTQLLDVSGAVVWTFQCL